MMSGVKLNVDAQIFEEQKACMLLWRWTPIRDALLGSPYDRRGEFPFWPFRSSAADD
jgi:hypothetical protein